MGVDRKRVAMVVNGVAFIAMIWSILLWVLPVETITRHFLPSFLDTIGSLAGSFAIGYYGTKLWLTKAENKAYKFLNESHHEGS